MLYYGFRIAPLPSFVAGASCVRFVNGLVIHLSQFRNPFANILPVRVEFLALQQRVENTKVRLRVDAYARTEAPASIVAGKVAIDEVLHEVSLALSPVNEQVLGQERGDDHAASVVHVTEMVQLTHGGIDNGESRSSLAPCREVVFVV